MMPARLGYQRADIKRLMDTSRPLTPLMREWIHRAESEQTDLGYDDWKSARRGRSSVSKASGPRSAAGKDES